MRFADVLKATQPPKKFKGAYAAGFDAGRYGPDTTNCHFGWFRTLKERAEWERGNRDGNETKRMELPT